jgi:hypothetical protein
MQLCISLSGCDWGLAGGHGAETDDMEAEYRCGEFA